MKYLMDAEIRTLLNLGKTVEMFLGQNRGEGTISWIDIQRESGQFFKLNVYSVFDDGDVDHVDIYDFSPVDPDEPFKTIEFETFDDMLAYLRNEFRLHDFSFLNHGMIQEEYRLLKESN
jgi:hypothetical protein